MTDREMILVELLAIKLYEHDKLAPRPWDQLTPEDRQIYRDMVLKEVENRARASSVDDEG